MSMHAEQIHDEQEQINVANAQCTSANAQVQMHVAKGQSTSVHVHCT